MPVKTTVPLIRSNQNNFEKIDYKIMGAAYSIHNELGRLLDESVYQEALNFECDNICLATRKEVPLRVSHKTFFKQYYLDLIVNDGVVYELKVASSISRAHESQLLNYLLLTDLAFGKIINFRGKSVEGRYVSTTLTLEQRRNFTISTEEWQPQTHRCHSIPDLLNDLLHDLGTHLDISLYAEMIHHLVAPNESIDKPVKLYRAGHCIGQQSLPLLNEATALQITSLKSGHQQYQNHLLRFLSHTRLLAIQWINFGPSNIQCITLKK
jgi:GxxExxY protein